MEGKTKSGFCFAIPDERLDNMELIDALGELEENPLMMGKICTMLLGSDQKKALYNHVRTKSGIVPASSVEKELAEIFNFHGETAKN